MWPTCGLPPLLRLPFNSRNSSKWCPRTQVLPNRKHLSTTKNATFWVVTPYSLAHSKNVSEEPAAFIAKGTIYQTTRRHVPEYRSSHSAVKTSTSHHASATETNRLMLFEETVAVNCEDRFTEHRFTSGRKYRVSVLLLEYDFQSGLHSSALLKCSPLLHQGLLPEHFYDHFRKCMSRWLWVPHQSSKLWFRLDAS
jgi:hypothetical protein